MNLAKTLAIGAAAIGPAAGSASGGEGNFAINDDSDILLEPVKIVAYVYGIDENRDGVIDGYLFLEESDTRA